MDREQYLRHLAAQKSRARKARAALPVHEKVRQMVKMQEIVAAHRARKGEQVRVWKID
jgi:hypothetical protein